MQIPQPRQWQTLISTCASAGTEAQNEFVIFDDRHPTTLTHTLLADFAWATLDAK
jgi:phospholipase/lecithinase/hemolysin